MTMRRRVMLTGQRHAYGKICRKYVPLWYCAHRHFRAVDLRSFVERICHPIMDKNIYLYPINKVDVVDEWRTDSRSVCTLFIFVRMQMDLPLCLGVFTTTFHVIWMPGTVGVLSSYPTICALFILCIHAYFSLFCFCRLSTSSAPVNRTEEYINMKKKRPFRTHWKEEGGRNVSDALIIIDRYLRELSTSHIHHRVWLIWAAED